MRVLKVMTCVLCFSCISGMCAAFLYALPKQQHQNKSTADHSKFEILNQNFEKPEDVTKACLSCHTDAASQVMKTIHWTWICPKSGDGKLGKAGMSLNNYCISIHGNEPRCTSCHAGYGWKDKSFDRTREESVDCLVCHEQTGTYKKFPAGAGYPVRETTVFEENGVTYNPPDYAMVAQSVARPARENCGICHFYGGGGDGVKHGDLDSSLFQPSRSLDVHMNKDGQNFSCVRCHTTDSHKIAGRCYQTAASSTERKSLVDDDTMAKISCEACHTSTPHNDAKLNDHTDIVACQTCHIPEFAREKPTKMEWDWSAAGKMKDGKPYSEKGEFGKQVYTSKKGVFKWAMNVVPTYSWFDGVIRNTLHTEKIDPSKTVKVNYVDATRDTPGARISPFKIHKGRQPYDKVNMTLIAPKLFGPKGSGAYWSDYDWKKSAEEGMKAAGLPFSGEVDFVDSEYLYPINHMVAPKDKSLSCAQCHTRNGSRLAGLSGFYMPGRDNFSLLDLMGWSGVLLSIAGVMIHGALRFAGRKKEK